MKSTIPRAKHATLGREIGSKSESTDKLAYSIAEEFDDIANLAVYQSLCARYPEAVIRKAHNATLSVSPDKVKRSRLALFIYLVKKYASESE